MRPHTSDATELTYTLRHQDIGVGSPNILSFNDWTPAKKGDDNSSAPSKKPEGKWRFEKEEQADESTEDLASTLVEQLQEELAVLRSEIRSEVDEVAELVKELAEGLNEQ